MKWEKIAFTELVEFPPRVILEQGELYDNIPMNVVDGGIKYVQEINQKIYTGGGAKFSNEDTIFARITPCLENGKIAKIKGLEKEVGFGSTEFFVFRAKEDTSDPDFIYYLAKTDILRQPAIKSMVGASGRQRADKGVVEQIKVPNIPLFTQRKIANILSAYDDLIENNLKRIKLLEEKAFLSYKGIVTSEKLEKVKLKEVAVLNELSLKSNTNIDKLLYVDIASVSIGSIDKITEYDLKDAPGRAKRILRHEDIIWSCVRPNRKSYSFVWSPVDNLIASTGFAVITAKKIPSTFLYHITVSNEFVDYLENHAKGATYPAVTAKDFEEALINMPSEFIMKEYHKSIYPLFELKHNLEKQNSKLRQARDILLPRLMNGEIEV
jgi:type I restriction enzyme, S subunit